MAKSSKHQRRKKALLTEGADGETAPKREVHKSSALKPQVPTRLDGTKLVKRRPKPAPSSKRNARQGPSVDAEEVANREQEGRKKKRRRSELINKEVDDGKEEEKASVAAAGDELSATIEEHDRFFSRLLDMIPEHLVLPPKEVPQASYASKYSKNKAEAAPQQSKKEESKKNKRARYSADNQKTLVERQQERARAEANGLVEGEANESDGEGEESDTEKDGGLQREVIRGKKMDVASMDALRQKIQDRIQNLQKDRTAAEGGRRAKTAAKRSAQVAKKRENERKGVKSKKKGKEPSTTPATSGGGAGGGADAGATPEKGEDGSKGQQGKKAQLVGPDPNASNGTYKPPHPVAEPQLPPLPSVEDIGDIEFGGLRGVVGKVGTDQRRPPKVGAPGSKMKRLHGLLAVAEEKKQRLAGLRKTEEGKEIAKQEGWEDAIRVAAGDELKDNPAALKKMIKRKEKEKAKSAKKWDHRLAGQRKEQAKKQDKREENLQKRKQGASAAAGAVGDNTDGAGKRQRRAGFEGKKQDFINKERPRGPAGSEGGRGAPGGRGRGRGGGGRGRGGASRG